MPSYFACRWQHDHDDEPVVLYEELDDERFELRKVHEYRDGRLQRSDRIALELPTSLSPEPVPSEREIDVEAEFTVLPLTSHEFETVWAKAQDAR